MNLVLGGTDTMQGVVEEITAEATDATTIPSHIQVEQGGDYILSGQIYDLHTASPETDNYLGGNLYVGIPLTQEQLQNATATNVGVIYFSSAGPQFIPGYLDTVESRVVFLTSHLSPYEPAVETPSAEIKRFIKEEATAMAFAAEGKLEEVAFEAFKQYLNKFDNLDAGTKALIQTAVMNNRDDIAAALTSSNPRDFQSVMASLNLAFGKAIADNVEESVLQGMLAQVSGNPDIICSVAEAAGSAAGGDYWKAVEILGKSYSESIPAVQGAQMAIRLMQFGWDAWKQHEWQTAYDAYAKGEPWEVVIHTYGGITDYSRDKFLKPDGSRMSLDEAEQLVKKLFAERQQREAQEAVEAQKLEAIYRDFQQQDKLTALAERLGMSRNPTTGKYDEPAAFRSYVSIYGSIARELTRLGLKRSWGAGDNWSPQIEARELFDTFVRDGAAAYHRKLAELEASTARSLAMAQACNLPPGDQATPMAAVWILKSIDPWQESPQEAADSCYNSFEITLGELSATTFAKCTWPSPAVDVWNRTQHSWSAAPPPRLSPGEKLQITSTVSTEGTYLTNGMSGGGNSWVRIDLEPGGGPYPGTGWASATEDATPGSAVSEFTIPSGGEGGLMLVSLRFQGPGGSGMTTYTYEWGGTGGP